MGRPFFYNKLNQKFLEKLLSNSILPVQSLLFWGEPAIGKATIALNFAQGLLCEKRKMGGCGKCLSCQMFVKNLHPDLLFVKPQQNEKHNSISLDTIKGGPEIQEGVIQFLSFKPQLSSYRIVIIDEADKMTPEAQNAFLKTLEEPNPNSLIILISAYPQKLLPTIHSRVVSLRFTRAPLNAIKEYLQKEYSLSPEQSAIIAQESEGKIGEAIKLLNKDYWDKIKKQKELLQKLLNSNFLEQERLLEDIFNTSEQELNEIEYLLALWLKELIKQKKYNLTRDLFRAYELISSYNVNKKLLLENIFLNQKSNSK